MGDVVAAPGAEVVVVHPATQAKRMTSTAIPRMWEKAS